VVADALYGDFAPDGRICFVRHVAQGGWTTAVGTAGPDGSGVRELARFPGRALVRPRWSPDGRTVALADEGFQAGERTAMVLVDTESGRSRPLAPAVAARSPEGLAWVDAATVVYAQPDVALGLYTSTSSAIVLQDVVSSGAQTLLSLPLDTRMVDVLGSGRLVFGARSFQGSLREINLQPSASGQGRWLTRGTSTDRQPVYDPGGEWIVFSSNRGRSLDLWAVSRATGAVRRLTDDAAEDWDPSFTPDGKLLWSSNRTGAFEVWTAEADGTGARQVTHDSGDDENPVATPDGQWILYASSSPRSHGIVRIRRDGSQATLFVAGNVLLPEVSPDGRYVAFVADLGAERAALRVARLPDGGMVPFEIALPPWLAAHSIDLGRCRWLPDGHALAFIGQELDGTYGVYVQDFAPGGTRTPRRRLVPFETDRAAESFGISRDGSHVTVAYWDQSSNLMMADKVPGIDRPPVQR
jgi:Tol biopolymer transport system component